MQLLIIAVGARLPDWAQMAWDEYTRRFSAQWRPVLCPIKTEPRNSGKTPGQCMAAEAHRISAALPRDCISVALDERGASLTSEGLAARLVRWQERSGAAAFIIGGPDGLHESIRKGASDSIRLSDLTLPHALARVLLIEQLYRACSINEGHPYHRS